MNLLPEKDKIIAKKEYLKRILATAGLFAAAYAGTSALLLVPPLLFLSNYHSILKEQALYHNKKITELNDKEMTEEIIKINGKISVLENEKSKNKLNVVFKKIIDKKPQGIAINAISYEKNKDNPDGRISISGNARRRNELLTFENALKNSFDFGKIKSPISNLLKESDVDFRLDIYGHY